MSYEQVGRVFASKVDACAAVAVDPDSVKLSTHFTRAECEGDRRGKRAASVKLFDDGRGGMVFNHKQSIFAVWSDKANGRLSKKEWAKRRRETLERQRAAEAHQAAEYAAAAEIAHEILMSACETVMHHDYLTKKHVRAVTPIRVINVEAANAICADRGMRNDRGEPWRFAGKGGLLRGACLVIPLKVAGRLTTVELIDAEGRKAFLKGGRTSGAYWMTRPICASSSFCIAEGVATALSVDLVFGLPCVAAMSAGQLESVTRSFVNAYPTSRIVIMGDNDSSGVGQKFAERVSRQLGVKYLIPTFTETDRAAFKAKTGGDTPSDWNDLFIARGEL